jgi:hypothetical protein
MERHAPRSDVTEAQIRRARDNLLATYRNAERHSGATPAVERMVLRSAVAANSAAAAHQLATGWSAEMAEPMDQFATEVRRDDLLTRMWPGGAILLAHLGVARVVLAILLGIIAWLLRTSALPEAVQLLACLLLLAAVVYLLGGPIVLYEADEVDRRISRLLEPDQREFFRLVDGSPPVMEPAKLAETHVGTAAKFLLLGLVGLILAPLLASALSIVRSMLTPGG